jgi:hypothetical protein
MAKVGDQDRAALGREAAATMNLGRTVGLTTVPDPRLRSAYESRLRAALQNGPETIAELWGEAFRSVDRGARSLALFSAAEGLAKTGELPDAASRVWSEAKNDVLIMIGYGSIMWQPSHPDEILFRMQGDLEGWRRTAEIGTYRRGASSERGGHSFSNDLQGGVLQTRARGPIEVRNQEGDWRSLGLGLSPAPGEKLRVVVDFIPRRDASGRDRSEEYLKAYDGREGSAASTPEGEHQNYYRRTLVPVAIGGPRSQVDGWVYATNRGGAADLSGLTLSQAARRIIDATEETPGEPQTLLDTDDTKRSQARSRSEGALLRMADRLDKAESASKANVDSARELQSIEAWVRKNVDPDFDRYRPTPTYQKGVHYWEGVAYGLRTMGARDQQVTNVMLAIRLWQAIARVRAEQSSGAHRGLRPQWTPPARTDQNAAKRISDPDPPSSHRDRS